jgi:hypothetical protein
MIKYGFILCLLITAGISNAMVLNLEKLIANYEPDKGEVLDEDIARNRLERGHILQEHARIIGREILNLRGRYAESSDQDKSPLRAKLEALEEELAFLKEAFFNTLVHYIVKDFYLGGVYRDEDKAYTQFVREAQALIDATKYESKPLTREDFSTEAELYERVEILSCAVAKGVFYK